MIMLSVITFSNLNYNSDVWFLAYCPSIFLKSYNHKIFYKIDAKVDIIKYSTIVDEMILHF
jgi:hypothetical protein